MNVKEPNTRRRVVVSPYGGPEEPRTIPKLNQNVFLSAVRDQAVARFVRERDWCPARDRELSLR